MPLGPGQPPAFLEALGPPHRLGGPAHRRRAAHRPHRPVLPPERPLPQRLLRPARADAARQRRQHRLRPGRLPPLRRRSSRPTPPRVMCTAAAPPDADGWCSLSLHAGATRRASSTRPAPTPIACSWSRCSDQFPRTFGGGRAPARARTSTRSTCSSRATARRSPPRTRRRPTSTGPSPSTSAPSSPTAPPCRPASARCPSTVAALLAEGDGGGYGIHSEMFTTGLMRLHQAGKVTNRKGMLRRRLGGHLRGRHPRALRLAPREPRGGVPARRPRELARAHRPQPRRWSRSTRRWPSTSTARSIADTIDGAQYSGIGGHEDFVAGPALDLEDRSLLCLPVHGHRSAASCARASCRGSRPAP